MNPDASDPTVPRRGTRRELRQSPGLQPTIPGSRTGKAPLTGTHSDRPDPASRQPPDRNVARSSSGFRVGDELGRGGMGTVRSAEDVDLGRELAIKFLQRADAESVERFLEEAQITAQLEHPNIVPVHQLGRDADGRPWLAMKRIDGQSLADHLTAEKQRPARLLPEDLDRCLQVFGKVCDAVAFAHSRGVIHRDIKPANVMVGAFGEVLLVDWGLARPLDVSDDAGKRPVRTARRNDASGALLTVDGDVFGTPAYMPPEQAEGRTDEVDERADIFALGGLLYHMLTLEPPYSGRTPTLTVAMAARHQLIPPRRRAPGRAIPKELQAIVLKAMAALPADRYQTVHDLQADLSAWHAFRRTTAWRAGPIERLVKWTRRHPTASLGVALFVVAGLVVAVLLSQLAAAREAETAARIGERLAAIERDKEKGRADTLGKLARAVQSAESSAAIEEARERLRVAREVGIDSNYIGRDMTPAERQRYLSAIIDLFRVHELNHEEPTASEHYFLGLMRQFTGDPQGAIAAFNRSLELDPQFVSALTSRCCCRLALGDHEGALADVDRALEIRPDGIPELINRAHLRVQIGDLHGALADSERVVELDPRSAEGLVNRASLRMVHGDMDGAIADCREALAISPGFATAFAVRGNVNLRLHQYDIALADLDEALRIYPRFATAMINRGTARLQLRQMDAALADFESALELAPRDVDALVGRAAARVGLGDMTAADADFELALSIAPTSAHVYHTRANARLTAGDRAGALADYNRAVELGPTLVIALTSRASLLGATGDDAGAMRDYSEAIRLDPDDLDARVGRANIRMKLQQPELAIADLDVALRAEPRLWQAHLNRAIALHTLHRDTEALPGLQTVFSGCPDPATRERIAGYIREIGGRVPDDDGRHR